ncbi:MAG: pantetheine-phosphate adenylyltransferase [bacterium]|jgi:pantetheine-phosphate adenylyltransferase
MAEKKIIVYPTSANPPTWGHADILQRAARQFDTVYWIAAVNKNKDHLFTPEERIDMMNDYVRYYKLENVITDYHSGATVRYAQAKNASFLLRGLRNTSDFHQELELAAGNRGIEKSIETVCFFAKPHYATISSTLVRELAFLDEDIEQYVLPSVAEKVKKYISQK